MSKGQTLNGIFWNTAERILLQIIQIVVSVVLARILVPADFGLIAMLTVFIALSDTIVQGGFRQTIIIRQNLSPIDYSTAFVYNLCVSVILYLGIFIAAPYIAGFYHEPKLVGVVRVLSLVNLINAGYMVQDALLQKNMRFKLLAQRNALASIISGSVSILLAVLGFGVWSLVFLTISRAVVINVFLWINSVWKFSLKFSWPSFKENFLFGSRIMLTNITNTIFDNIYNLIIGKYYSKADLGYYYQANKLQRVPIDSMSGVISKTATPLLARHQDDLPQLHKNYFYLFKLSAIVIIPMIMLLLVISKDLIILLYTAKWAASIKIFRILIIGGFFFPFVVLNGISPTIMGDTKFYLILDTAYKVLRVIIIVVSLSLGLMAFIAGQTIFVILQMLGNSVIACKFYRVSLIKQYLVFARYFLMSLIAGVMAYLMGRLGFIPLPVRLCGAVLVFGIVYAGSVFVLDRSSWNLATGYGKKGWNRLVQAFSPGSRIKET